MIRHSFAGEVAQCVMCYRTAAAQQAERSRVLNSGIVILLIPPILVLALILLLAFRKNRVAASTAAADLSEGKR
jgi:hypothetical protein